MPIVSLRIPDLVRNKYVATQSAAVTKIEDAIARNKNLKVALQGTLDESASTLPSSSGDVPADSGSRTLASPDYSGAIDVPNFSTRVHLEEKPMDEFTAGRTILIAYQEMFWSLFFDQYLLSLFFVFFRTGIRSTI